MRVDLSELKELIAKVKEVLDEPTILRAIGLKHLEWINQNFNDEGTETKWAPMRPGGRQGQLLRDTGRLRQSFVANVADNVVNIGSAMDTAVFHHFGTQPYTIRPLREGGRLRFMVGGEVVYARLVNHPGLPARPLLPTERTSAELATSILEATLSVLES